MKYVCSLILTILVSGWAYSDHGGDDAVDVGLRAVRLLNARTQQKEMARHYELLSQALIDEGDAIRAEAVAGKITNWRRGAVKARLGCYYGLNGDPVRSDRMFFLAGEWQKFIRDQQLDGTLGWGADRVGRHIIESRLSLGQFAPAREHLKTIDAADRAIAEHLILIKEPAALQDKAEALIAKLSIQETSIEESVGHAFAELMSAAGSQGDLELLYKGIQNSISDLPFTMRADIFQHLFAAVPQQFLRLPQTVEMLEEYESVITRLSGAEKVKHVMIQAAVYGSSGDTGRQSALIGEAAGYVDSNRYTRYGFMYLLAISEGYVLNGKTDLAIEGVEQTLAALESTRSKLHFVQGMVRLCCFLYANEALSREFVPQAVRLVEGVHVSS